MSLIKDMAKITFPDGRELSGEVTKKANSSRTYTDRNTCWQVTLIDEFGNTHNWDQTVEGGTVSFTRIAPKVTCHICKKEEELFFDDETITTCLKESVCFHCWFWLNVIETPKCKSVRVKGIHYTIGEVLPDNYQGFKGFGGSLFKIKFHDGRYIESKNLWCNGTVPEHFKDKLSDNAEFVK